MAITRIMRIEGANIPFTCKQIAKMVGQGKISFDNIVQRSYVWENKRRSEFVWSIIMGYPIPPVYAKRGVAEDNAKTKVYDVLDGQQRLTTIYKFINDEFSLSDLNDIHYFDEEDNECVIDISGKKFSELDEEIQDAVCDRTISFNYYDSINQDECAEMFRRLNNGKALSAKSRTLASCRDIRGLLNIGEHKIFSEMITEKARENKNQAVIVMKAWCMLNQEIINVSFESKVFNPLLENTEITDEQKIIMNNVFDYAVSVHEWLLGNKEKKTAKKMYTETHFISLIPYFYKAIENKIDESLFAEWLVSFFGSKEKVSFDGNYNEACTSGVAKNANIMDRDDALSSSFDDYFEKDEKAEDNDEEELEDEYSETDCEEEDFEEDDE